MNTIDIVKYVAIVILLLVGSKLLANTMKGVDKKTFVYSTKDGQELKLDKYVSATKQQGKKPCVVFAFGGGFVAGTRDRKDYLPHFEHLANKGYIVVSIDYRLGLKELVDSGNEPTIKGLIKALEHSVNIASEDMMLATSYILQNADSWGVDKDLVVATGSSAGAIAALHSEYNICNNSELATILPEDFKYAGVISYAGAIFSTKGKLKWENKPAPMLLFHGSADSNVPYNKIKIPFTRIGFYGSKYIVKQLKKMKLPYHFYDVENANHIIADVPMTRNLNEIESFLTKLVIEKQNINIHSEIKQLDKGERKRVKLKDYITSNM